MAGGLRGAAARRGLDASWAALRVSPGLVVRVQDLTLRRRADGDTLFRGDSLTVSLDPGSLLLLHPWPGRVVLAHARVHLSTRRGADADTLAPEEFRAPRARAGDAQRAERLRGVARSFVRLLAAPARSFPRLSLIDVWLTAGPRSAAGVQGAAAAGLRLRRLELAPSRRGPRFEAAGSLLGEREVPFDVFLAYGLDDRLTGDARFDIPGVGRARREPLRITVDGALSQDRNAGRVTFSDSTRVTIGALRLRLRGAIERSGPRFRIAVVGDSLTADQWRRSLPAVMLGPLAGLAVRGWYSQRVSLDLDLARPDRVEFAAAVVPHGLRIDPAATRLELLGLDRPFVARIHLPHDRIVERDLSPANPHYRPLDAIDTLLVNAVVTNEDGAFFRHRGFNTEAVKGAIAANARAGAYRRGAGTITMQLVRNLYLGHARTLSRKGQEVVLAWVIEHLTGLTKERMLEIYLNIIEWGPGIHGADEAAHYYFGHDAGHLSPDEALFLATVVPAPTRWRNRFDADGALQPFERAQMRFIGRAMVARNRLSPALLPEADAMHVELRGAARNALLPSTEIHAETLPS